jgi:glycosyltransferase involved in cell wall biosynthesis
LAAVSITELQQTIEGASRKGAPLVFWDGYGLERPGSGVYVHANELAKALAERQLYPGVLLPTDAPWPGHSWTLPALPPTKLTTSKLVWPHRVAAIVDLLAQKSERRPILHGLSNLNVSKKRSDRYRTVLTVHDVIPLIAPGSVSGAYYWQFKLGFQRALAAADKVVCVSRWTERCIAERYPQHRAKLVTIMNGMTLLPQKPRRDGAGVRLIAVGRHETYKRFALVLNLLRRAPTDWTLHFVTDARGVEFARSHATDLIVASRLTVESGVSHADLAKAYGEADVLVHPSLFEGFGLPISEALSVGRPVVYVGGSAMDEIVQNGLGVRLQATATADEWQTGVERALVEAREADFGARLAAWRGTQPTWKDAASGMERLYNDLQ